MVLSGGFTNELNTNIDRINPHSKDIFEYAKKNLQRNEHVEMKIIGYCSQVVAGTNYWIKLNFDNDSECWVKMYEPLPCYNKPIEFLEFSMTFPF
nr:stefin [Ceratonova shasta]